MSAFIQPRDKTLIRRALADPEFRALAKIVGALLPLKPTAQRRVIDWVVDAEAERRAGL